VQWHEPPVLELVVDHEERLVRILVVRSDWLAIRR
jgi:hypothetical protein